MSWFIRAVFKCIRSARDCLRLESEIKEYEKVYQQLKETNKELFVENLRLKGQLERAEQELVRIWSWTPKLKYERPPSDVGELSRKLREWYVPPDEIARAKLKQATQGDIWNALQKEIPTFGPEHYLPLDGRYYVPTLETFKKMVEWDWTDAKKYELDRFDCDKYAVTFKARMAFEFGVNSIGVVVDYDGGHAYNVVVVWNEEKNMYDAWLFEPQTDALFKYKDRPGGEGGHYSLTKMYVILI